MIIRPATAGDAPGVAAIYGNHVLTGLGTFEEVPPSDEEIGGRIAAVQDRGLPYLVAEDEGAVIGFAYAAPFRPRAAYRYTVENSIYIAPEAHRRGVGRALLHRLIKECEARNYRLMIAVIGDSAQTPSIELHRAAGFKMVGAFEAVGYKFDRWLDSVLMQRPLGKGSSAPP